MSLPDMGPTNTLIGKGTHGAEGSSIIHTIFGNFNVRFYKYRVR